MTRARVVALAIAAVALGLLAVLRHEVPQWRSGGTESISASSVAVLPLKLACPPNGANIAILGDSHVAGSRMQGAGAAFGVAMEEALAGRVQVTSYGIGGETAIGGERRWRGRDLPGTDLVILAYGTNDAAPRGWLRGKTAVLPSDFKAALTRQVAGWRERGKDVVVLAPPPGGSLAIAGRIAPYRQAASDAARALGVAVLDPADAFASCPQAQPVLTYDALHMNGAGHACLGKWLGHQFCPAPG